MSYSNNYGGLIWTHHALQRLSERGITQEIAWDAVKHPDEITKGKRHGTWEYKKKVHAFLVTVVAAENDTKELVILSVVALPPLPGTIEEKRKQAHKNHLNFPWWKKMLYTLWNQLNP